MFDTNEISGKTWISTLSWGKLLSARGIPCRRNVARDQVNIPDWVGVIDKLINKSGLQSVSETDPIAHHVANVITYFYTHSEECSILMSIYYISGGHAAREFLEAKTDAL